jgi:hypothetical protein
MSLEREGERGGGERGEIAWVLQLIYYSGIEKGLSYEGL